MKKALMLAIVMAVAMGSTAFAQDSVLWFDIRNNTGGEFTTPLNIMDNQNITDPAYAPVRPFTNGQTVFGTAFNGGGRGDGQVLRIMAHHADDLETSFPADAYPNFDGDGDLKTGDLYLYMDVNTVIDAQDTISSLGLDVETTDAGAGGKARIASMDFTWDLSPLPSMFVDANTGSVDAAGAGDPPVITGAKAVKVPVTAGPVFDTTGTLIQPSDQPYRIAKISVVGGDRVVGPPDILLTEANQTFNVHLKTNSLLITRVNPAGDPGSEDVAFGYNGASPETPYIDGSVDAQTSAEPDAVIIISFKGDGTGDYRVRNNDFASFDAARTASPDLTQAQMYAFDFTGDRRVRNNDFASWDAARSGS
jgi:hypothetical protein